MAKRELTPEQKKQAAENLARARAAKKEAAAQAAPVAEALRVDPVVTDFDVEREAREDEREMKKRLFADEPVPFILPIDPGNEAQDQVFTRSFNGFIINIRRGERVTLPRKVVQFIESCERIQRESDAAASVYTTGNGKML